ncbi:MAG: GTPase HflX [Chloroflexi bacterium]|nr:GTPase HflX [Chloroflexota bacterium]
MPERAFLIGVSVKGARGPWRLEDSLKELGQLARSAGAEVVGTLSQQLPRPSSSYLGKGKLEEVKGLRTDLHFDVVIADDELSPSQQRILEDRLKIKVIDRSALILDVFASRATTREGRLQVELAQHEYLLPRLAGQWKHLERLGGGIGTRGPGESQLETDRRLIRNKLHHLKQQIEDIRTHRSLYRQDRKRRGAPVVALVGYTNSGKSTLLNRLTKADVLVEDKLFATLDPVTRRWHLPQIGYVLLTDTVGFIQKLPPILVAAFRATLEELSDADLLLHLVDVNHPNAAEQVEEVQRILKTLGLSGKPSVTVLNKIDLLFDNGHRPTDDLPGVENWAIPGDMVAVSAMTGRGLDRLRTLVADRLAMAPVPI